MRVKSRKMWFDFSIEAEELALLEAATKQRRVNAKQTEKS
jgi:hypothetical protein